MKPEKPQFTYCKLEDYQQLETLLNSLNFQFPTAKAKREKLGQESTEDQAKLGHKDASPKKENKSLGSLAWWGVTLVR